MKRLAVLGANGQVGAEVCLLLSRLEAVEVVPVCRNRLGSAFLRSRGIRCRHGIPSDPAQGPALFGDCDLVANFALAGGKPSEAARADRGIVLSTVSCSRPDARLVFISTQNVYGDPRRDAPLRVRDAYGRGKLRSERIFVRAARRHRRDAFVLRLGHVCGELQNITADIRARIAGGAVNLPEGGATPSNTVYTATIVDALLSILRGDQTPGTYDLMNVPPWTWREVYEFEAARLGVPLALRRAPHASPRPGLLQSAIRRVQSSDRLRQIARRALARLPAELNLRSHASHLTAMAAAQIAALERSEPPPEGTLWVENGRRFLPGLRSTSDTLSAGGGRVPNLESRDAFPPDLETASRGA